MAMASNSARLLGPRPSPKERAAGRGREWRAGGEGGGARVGNDQVASVVVDELPKVSMAIPDRNKGIRTFFETAFPMRFDLMPLPPLA